MDSTFLTFLTFLHDESLAFHMVLLWYFGQSKVFRVLIIFDFTIFFLRVMKMKLSLLVEKALRKIQKLWS